MVKTLKAKETESEQRVAEVRELQATIELMRGDALERERRLSELDKKLLAMNGSMSRLESNKQLLELKVKELEIVDLSKRHVEMGARLREFSKLYDVVKADRNKYVNQITASATSAATGKSRSINRRPSRRRESCSPSRVLPTSSGWPPRRCTAGSWTASFPANK